MTNQSDAVNLSNLDAISQAEQIKFTPHTSLGQPETPNLRTGANKGVKAPAQPKIKVNHGKQKRGGRHSTSPAQRSASRRNIHKALLAKASRRLR